MLYRLTIDAFPVTPAGAEAIAQFAADRSFAKSRVTSRPGGLAGAIEHYHTDATPQVVIVEEPEDEATLFARLGQLAEVCMAGTKVLVIGSVNDVGLYRRLLGQGISEYFVGPVQAGQIVAAVESLFADPGAAPRGRLTAFFGARGGVGSSTLAHNTGWALAEVAGDHVILLDLDLAFGTLGLAFNVEARQTVGEQLGEPDRIDDQLLDRLLIKYDDHLQLLPSPSLLKSWPPIEAETVDKLLEVVRRMAGHVVIDLPHLWAPWVTHVLELVDDLVIVAQPDLANLRDCKALLDEVRPRRGDGASTHLLLNKVDAFKKTQLSAKDFEDTLKLKPGLSLPFDPVFGEASNNGQMVAEAAKTHRAVDGFRQLAARLARKPEVARRRNAAVMGAGLSAGLGGLAALVKKVKPAR